MLGVAGLLEELSGLGRRDNHGHAGAPALLAVNSNVAPESFHAL